MTIKVMKFVRAFYAGGTERQFANLALGLDPSRVDVRFGCLRRSGELLDEIDRRGIPVLDYDVVSFRRAGLAAAQLRLVRDIRRHNIQIVHTYGFAAHLFAIPAAKLAGARVVASIRDLGVYLSPMRRRVQRMLCRFADRILVNATAIRDCLIEEGYAADRITVIPNGIDVDRFARGSRTGRLHSQFGFPEGSPIIGVVGRISRLKGLEDFLYAATIIAARFPAARFVIVGDAFTLNGRVAVRDEPYLEELAARTAKLGLRDRLVFAGMRDDVEHILPELSVSVLPSLSEGLSNALLESMAAGIPIVATRVGGTAEAVRDGENGLLIRSGDPRAMAGAVCRLLDMPALAGRLGKAAQQSISTHYSAARAVESTTLVYDALVRHPVTGNADSSTYRRDPRLIPE